MLVKHQPTWLFSLLVADGLSDGLHHLQLLWIREVTRMWGVAKNVRPDVDVSPEENQS